MKKFNLLIVLTAGVLLTGCLAFKPLVSSTAEKSMTKAEVSGALVHDGTYRLTLKDGRQVILKFRRVDEDNAYGFVTLLNLGRDVDSRVRKNPNGIVRLDQIAKIEVRRVSPGETATVVSLGVAAAIGLLLYSTAGGISSSGI